jgi:hypothetical protein
VKFVKEMLDQGASEPPSRHAEGLQRTQSACPPSDSPADSSADAPQTDGAISCFREEAWIGPGLLPPKRRESLKFERTDTPARIERERHIGAAEALAPPVRAERIIVPVLKVGLIVR